MSDSVRDLLVRGIAAAKAQSGAEARFYLEWALRLDGDTDQRIQAWYWLSEVSADPAEKRDLLETILGYQPSHALARRSLAILDGRLDPQEIIDPDRLPAHPATGPVDTGARRFVCPQCGGRLTYTPDGQSLTCEYCEGRQGRGAQKDRPTAKDFTVAMATARGHTRPQAERACTCQGCGASFLIAPQALSINCPYCTSVYVLEDRDTRELIPPDAIIPFSQSREQVQETLRRRLAAVRRSRAVRVAAPAGFYLPVWRFSVSGQVPWDGQEYSGGDWQPRSGLSLALFEDLLVPASRKWPQAWADEIQHYQLAGLVPYEPAYLADWPAETYQVSMSDASLDARWQALERMRATLTEKFHGQVRDLRLNSMDLVVESFQLILLPVWVIELKDRSSQVRVLVNGQTGSLHP